MLLEGSLWSGPVTWLLLSLPAKAAAAASSATASSVASCRPTTSSPDTSSCCDACLPGPSLGLCTCAVSGWACCHAGDLAGAWPELKRPPLPSSSQGSCPRGVARSESSLPSEPGSSLCCIACHSDAGPASVGEAALLGSLCLRSISCMALAIKKGNLSCSSPVSWLINPAEWLVRDTPYMHECHFALSCHLGLRPVCRS